MKLEEIRGLATEDPEKKAGDMHEELFRLRYAAQAESIDNTKKIRDARRMVARLRTVLGERQLGIVHEKGKTFRRAPETAPAASE